MYSTAIATQSGDSESNVISYCSVISTSRSRTGYITRQNGACNCKRSEAIAAYFHQVL
ncbi:hypothetical protein BofuT4_P130400.1 [Botrytis cinerea T4]|uniref:Uncharacterized protein n=1 Tax=Botryotinia fuckeliana (strain T4) TaxID=999810 RepID=G2YRU2_BOTF4|nr:hypothetical protein BofuT4_P130400.1 [Botrytis cinerea T4]